MSKSIHLNIHYALKITGWCAEGWRYTSILQGPGRCTPCDPFLILSSNPMKQGNRPIRVREMKVEMQVHCHKRTIWKRELLTPHVFTAAAHFSNNIKRLAYIYHRPSEVRVFGMKKMSFFVKRMKGRACLGVHPALLKNNLHMCMKGKLHKRL